MLRLRGALGSLGDTDWVDQTVLLDDAHLLCPLDLARVAERIEDASGGARLIIAGRVLADILHEATHLVDGLIIDAGALAIDADEVAAELPAGLMTLARRIVEAADGCVRVIATSLDQSRRDPSTDPVALASRMVRVASEAALQHLTPREHAVVALLARTPGIDSHLLDKLAGDGFVDRAVAAGVPLRRQLTGALDIASASAFRAAPIDPETAGALAAELLERGRALEAVGLLLDAGDVERATAMVLTLSESITDTVEPRQMLSLLARLGPVADREPALLLLRASATRSLGRVDEAVVDIDRAVTMATSSPPPLRRRVSIESARARLAEGRRDEAERIAERTLLELGDGRGPHVRPRARGARRVRGHLRRPGGPAAGGRALPRRCRGVGGQRRVRPGQGLPARPRPVRAVAPRSLRRGAGPGRPVARHRRPVRHRALLDADGRGLRAVQRQPAGER